MHWMIVEDEADIRNLVVTMATVWGHTTIAFESGGKAWDWIDLVEAGQYHKPLPEFALMDIRAGCDCGSPERNARPHCGDLFRF